MRTHGALTEPSRRYHPVTHDRKGREGKGIGREGRTCGDFSSIRHLPNARTVRLGWMPTALNSQAVEVLR